MFLVQIKLMQAHEWTKRERSKVGDDLSKVIEVGLLKPNVATDVVAMVMKLVTEQRERKVLLAIDSFNGCFNSTSLSLGKKEWVKVVSNSVLQENFVGFNFRYQALKAWSRFCCMP